MVESDHLESNYRNGELMDLHVLKFSEPIFERLVCASVCYQHNSKTNNSRNFKFYIIHVYLMQMLREKFYKNRTKSVYKDTQKNSNILRPMDKIFW